MVEDVPLWAKVLRHLRHGASRTPLPLHHHRHLRAVTNPAAAKFRDTCRLAHNLALADVEVGPSVYRQHRSSNGSKVTVS